MPKLRLHPAVAASLLLLSLVLALPGTGGLVESAGIITFVVGLYYKTW